MTDRNYESLVKWLRQSAKNCSMMDMDCSTCAGDDCEGHERIIFLDAADAIVELLAVLGNIASAVFNYGDDPGLSEIIMRKLWKVGIVKMDGDLWVWNTPTKEED